MGILDTFKGNEYKRQLEEASAKIAELEALLTPEMREALSIQEKIKQLNAQKNSLDDVIDAQRELEAARERKVRELDAKIKEKESQLVTFDDAILVQDFGLYEPRFDFASSTQFKDRLKQCRDRQKEQIKRINKSTESTQ